MRGVRLSALAALFVSIAVVGSAEPQATAAGQRVSVPHVVRFDGVFVPADGQPAAHGTTREFATAVFSLSGAEAEESRERQALPASVFGSMRRGVVKAIDQLEGKMQCE